MTGATYTDTQLIMEELSLVRSWQTTFIATVPVRVPRRTALLHEDSAWAEGIPRLGSKAD
jgi:hypothetical protein